MEDKKYIVKQHEENTQLIINEDTGEVVNIITKDTVIDYCKREYDTVDTDYMSGYGIIENAWFDLCNDYPMDFVDDFAMNLISFLLGFIIFVLNILQIKQLKSINKDYLILSSPFLFIHFPSGNFRRRGRNSVGILYHNFRHLSIVISVGWSI